ncbi:MAG: hypothetical protein ACE14L_03955 [Terriglobales bacterium]
MNPAFISLLCLLFAVPGFAQQTPAAQPQPLPNAPSAHLAARHAGQRHYTPLSSRDKFHRWVRHTYSPYTFLSTAVSAGWAQAMGDWPTYGGGMEGYGKRFGATLADTETRGFFKVFLFPTLLHQDPRYFRSESRSVPLRAGHAMTRVIITRRDDGEQTFNSSQLFGTLAAKSLTNAYYPDRDRGFKHTMSGVASAYLSDATANLLREFWPDIRRLFQRHAPEPVKKIEEKIPEPIGDIAKPAPPET